ncbi:MAG: energy transducer TonB [Saprospiraceae bacterium]|nr:energy transducer TonB [Saprospiraceae bacterium]MCB9323979.1 energy transducer TonB [Lewinellaceae bacterium]
MNLLNIAIDGNTFGMIILGLIAAFVIMITLMRYFLHRKAGEDLSAYADKKTIPSLSERNKYRPVDVFRLSGTFFNIGLSVALGLSVLAFGWTKFEKPIHFADMSITWSGDEVEITRTKDPEPQKLPPPPVKPEFEVVDNEIPVDTVTFVDSSVEYARPEPAATPRPKAIVLPPEKKDETEDIPFRVVEEMPRFPGCEDMAGSKAEKKQCADMKLLQFIQNNIKYPAIARENGIQGRCFVTFVVEKDGSVSNIELVRDIGGQCGAESMRVVHIMANSGLKWTPGKQRGIPVRVQFNLPVHFRLE